MQFLGQPVRRPLIGVVLAIVAGILLGAHVSAGVEWFIFSALLVLVCSFFLRKLRGGAVWVLLSVVFVSAANFSVSDFLKKNQSIEIRGDELPRSRTEVVGLVLGEPRFLPYKKGKKGMWIFPVKLEGEWRSGKWIRVSGWLDVRVMGGLPDLPSAQFEQRVWLRGELQKSYYEGRPLRFKAYAGDCCVPLSPPKLSFIAGCRTWRKNVAKRLSDGMEGHLSQLAVLRALVLGYRNEIPKETYACFRRTGLLHIFAISGLHVGLVGALLVIVLKSLGISRVWFGVWLLPLLFAYVVATGMKDSALRAVIMAGVFLLAPLFRSRPDVPSSIAFAGVLLLLIDPHAIESIGFIFSFTIVAFIVMVYSKIPERWGFGNRARIYVVSLLITSLAAGLGSIPVTAYYFGRVSSVALLGNLFVVPLTFCILISGWLSVLLPVASSIFNHASLVFIDLMLGGIRWIDSLPGSSFDVNPPSFEALALWYGGLLYLFTHATCRRQFVSGFFVFGAGVLWVVLGCAGVFTAT